MTIAQQVKLSNDIKIQLWPRYVRDHIYSTFMEKEFDKACELANWLDRYEPQNKRLSFGDEDKIYERMIPLLK